MYRLILSSRGRATARSLVAATAAFVLFGVLVSSNMLDAQCSTYPDYPYTTWHVDRPPLFYLLTFEMNDALSGGNPFQTVTVVEGAFAPGSPFVLEFAVSSTGVVVLTVEGMFTPDACGIPITWSSSFPTAEGDGTLFFGGAEPLEFVRADCNRDGVLTLADAIFEFGALHIPGSPLPTCDQACDANGDGNFDVSDPVFTLNFLFQSGPMPPEPYPNCGFEPVSSGLTCLAYWVCP